MNTLNDLLGQGEPAWILIGHALGALVLIGWCIGRVVRWVRDEITWLDVGVTSTAIVSLGSVLAWEFYLVTA